MPGTLFTQGLYLAALWSSLATWLEEACWLVLQLERSLLSLPTAEIGSWSRLDQTQWQPAIPSFAVAPELQTIEIKCQSD